ncbi:MAG: hypothetical protein J0L99_15040 [Chitinophagales bacterium]|nr:hypothetical protein [Chitinophagales bacterium]
MSMINGKDALEYSNSTKHGVKIYQNGQIVNNCMVMGSGGATGVHPNSMLLDEDQLLLCCGNTIFCFTLPDLQLKWKTQADQATCFSIFKLHNDFIVHGEMQVSALDKEGCIKWSFQGQDIFVTMDKQDPFKIEEDGILLTDFTGATYKIDFAGNLIWSYHNKKHLERP